MERAFAVIADDEPDEDLAAVRRTTWRSATGTAPTSSVRPSGWSLRSTSQRRIRIPRPLVVALRAKSALAESRGHHEESLRAPAPCAAARARARVLRRSEHVLLHPLRQVLPARRVRRCARIPRRGARARAKARQPSVRMGVLAERTYPDVDAGPLGRGAGDERRVHAGADRLRRDGAEPAGVVHGHPDRARRARRRAPDAARCSRGSRTPPTSRTCPATSDRAPRCSGPRDDSPMRWRTPSRPSRCSRTLGVAAQSTKQGIVEGSKRPSRSAIPRRPRSCS